MASARYYAAVYDITLKFKWAVNKACHAPINDLFDVCKSDIIMEDVNTYENCIPIHTPILGYVQFDLNKEVQSISLCRYINYEEYPITPEIINSQHKKLVLIDSIKEIIDTFKMPPLIKGVHIRRGDFLTKAPGRTRHNHETIFINFIEEEIKKDDRISFYLCTDSEEVFQLFKNKYGDRIYSYTQGITDRCNSQGIINAVIDLYLLNRTEKIYGSVGSSFSSTSAIINNFIPLQTKLHTNGHLK